MSELKDDILSIYASGEGVSNQKLFHNLNVKYGYGKDEKTQHVIRATQQALKNEGKITQLFHGVWKAI